MKQGYIFNASKKILFIETDARQTDATARAVLDIIGELYHSKPETLTRAKADPATLADIKKRLIRATTDTDGTRRRIYYNGRLYMNIPAQDNTFLIFQADRATL